MSTITSAQYDALLGQRVTVTYIPGGEFSPVTTEGVAQPRCSSSGRVTPDGEFVKLSDATITERFGTRQSRGVQVKLAVLLSLGVGVLRKS